MKETLISFETAKLAERKGFINYLCTLDKWLNINNITVTQSLLQKWLREKHYIHIIINTLGQYNYRLEVDKIGGKTILLGSNHSTYEKALEIGLQEALKLI